jgi:NADH:ubiquinone oxidoreductase subunit 6 (subunit J)
MTTMSIRLKLASGTGFLFNYWPLPSEMLGVINMWTGTPGAPRDPVILLIGFLLSAGFIWVVLRGLRSKNAWDRSVSILGLSILIVCAAVALWAKNTSLSSNYSYVKVATYVGPIFLLIIAERMSQNLNQKKAKNKKNDTPYWLRMVTPVFYVTLMVASVLSANSGLIKKQEYGFPAAMTAILKDKAAQAELSNYNYLTTYRSLSNVLGFLGNTHWVGKAPNDILLGTRMDKEMRIICFASDALCAPKSPQIQNDILARYSLKVYQSPITTAEYAALKPLDRFYADMDAVGSGSI